MPNSKTKEAMRVVDVLKKRYDDVGRGEVTSTSAEDPFRVLVSTIISQRNRDEVTREVAERLFEHANTPEDMVKLGRKEIASVIKSANYYKTKAKYIYESSKMVLEEFGGKVPDSREELTKLPGVGGKTADIILLVSYGEDVIPVDTHVATVSYRLGWTESDEKRERIREDLHEIFPPSERGYINMLLVQFGKEICQSPKPKCYKCPVVKLCPYPYKNQER